MALDPVDAEDGDGSERWAMSLNPTAAPQKQDVDRVVRVLDEILAKLTPATELVKCARCDGTGTNPLYKDRSGICRGCNGAGVQRV